MATTKPSPENKYQRARAISGCAANAPAATPQRGGDGSGSTACAFAAAVRRAGAGGAHPGTVGGVAARRPLGAADLGCDGAAGFGGLLCLDCRGRRWAGASGHRPADPGGALAVCDQSRRHERRELNDLCVEHLAYIWLCGGVSMNYHTLSDFRTQHLSALDALLTQVLGCLDYAGLITYEHTAQDGMRVRASAGAASFRREATLEKCLTAAQAAVAALTAGAADTAPLSPGSQAARARAATERVARLEAALAELSAAQAAKAAAKQAEVRVSTTDPEARVMKMADGGFRPAYNFEFATDTAQRVIVGVDVTNAGSDKAEAGPHDSPRTGALCAAARRLADRRRLCQPSGPGSRRRPRLTGPGASTQTQRPHPRSGVAPG